MCCVAPFVQFKNDEEFLHGCNFNKNNTHLWVFFTFFKLYKWYQIAQNLTYLTKCRASGKCGRQTDAAFTRLERHMEKLLLFVKIC